MTNEEYKQFIEKNVGIGLDTPRPAGIQMLIKTYIRPEDMHEVKNDDGSSILGPDGKPTVIYLPSKVTENDRWKNITGLVLAQGPMCYKGEQFKESGPWCYIGDWILFAPNEGTQFIYRGVPMRMIYDTKCLGIVSDPSYVTRD